MKIAVINNFVSPFNVGGAEIATQSFVESLARRGHNVIQITSGRKRKVEVFSPLPGLKSYRFFPVNFYFAYPPDVKRSRLVKVLWWLLNLWNPFVFLKVKKILRKERPEVVNLHNFYSLSPSVFTAALSCGAPVFYTAFDYFPICKNSIFNKRGRTCWKQCSSCEVWSFWNRLFLRRAEFIFPSAFSRALFRKHLGKDGYLIRNPLSSTAEEIIANRETKSKNRMKKPTFLFLGRLGQHKGISILLEAFQKVESKDIALLIAGSGEWEGKIEEYAEKDPRVRFVGFVSGEKKRELLRQADVLVFPTECFEVTPVSIMEAFCHGLPVIATEIGSIPEYIEEGKTGWLFPYGDADRLSSLMDGLAEDREKISSSSQHSFKKALEIAGQDRLVDILTVFEKARASRRSS